MKAYSEYKDSGIDWIGKIPKSWELLRLKNILSNKITDGPHETPTWADEGIPFLSVDGIQEGELYFENCRYISEEDHERYSKKANIEKMDILMGKAASIGKIAQVKVDFEFSIWSPLALIKINKKVSHPTYLEYYLKSKNCQYQIEILATSNTQKNISMDDIPKINILLPPLPEQKAIASFLDNKTSKINELVNNKQKLIELLKEQRTALINNAVTKGLNENVEFVDSGVEWIGKIPKGWKCNKIKRLTRVKRGASPRPIDDQKYFDDNGEYAWVRIADVTASDRYLEKTTQRLSELGSSLSVKMNENDLFISIAGTVGKPIISKIKCCIHDGFVYFPDLTIDKEYLYYVFMSGRCYLGLGKLGTQLNLNTETVGCIDIPLPPKMEICEIIRFLDNETSKIDKSIEKIQKEIELLQEYKDALISEVVIGKIKVTEGQL
jgi:type I restriction enzyme, S subunit